MGHYKPFDVQTSSFTRPTKEGWWKEDAHDPPFLVYPSFSKGKDIVFSFAPLIDAAAAQPHMH